MLTDSTSRDTPVLAALEGLTPAQWRLVGGGALLALTGSGLLSLGTLVRLAAVVGGGAMVYQALKSAAPADTAADTGTGTGIGGDTAGSVSNLTPSAWAARPSLREAPAAHDPDTEGSTMAGAAPIPFGSLRGA